MVKQDDIIFAFDLDGTISDYGCSVKENVAKHINELGHTHIITGSDYNTADKATKFLLNKTIHAMRVWIGNKSIDCSKIADVTKAHFHRSAPHQSLRRNLCLALRDVMHEHIYIGGRSTIDIMGVKNKGHVINKLQADGKRVIYFYDCRWTMNEDINNDIPAITKAWKSIRTDHRSIISDIKKCLKELS